MSHSLIHKDEGDMSLGLVFNLHASSLWFPRYLEFALPGSERW